MGKNVLAQVRLILCEHTINKNLAQEDDSREGMDRIGERTDLNIDQ